MTFTIGRFTAPRDPYAVEMDGDRVTFGLHLVPTVAGDDDHLHALRQQMLGLVGNEDEEVVPVTWSADATFDGFYRVTGVSVPTSPILIRDAIVLNCTVSLERLGGYANPWFEILTTTVVRTNVHSVTTPQGVVGAFQIPSGDSQYELSAIRAYTLTTATLDTGDTLNIYKSAAPKTSKNFRFSTSASKFYSGAVKLELRYGSTWYPVVGRQWVANDSSVWRISNGLVRLTSCDGATAGTFEIWDNTAQAWESQSIQHCIPGSGGTAGQALDAGKIGQTIDGTDVAPAILRNSPEDVTIKLDGGDSSVVWRMTRGAYHVEGVGRVDGNAEAGVGYSTAIACTAFTSGMWRTTADANGNGLTFTGPGTVSGITAASGRIAWSGSDGYGQFAVCANPGATDATVAATRRDEFLSALSWRQRVIVR